MAEIRSMTISDYDAVMLLMQARPGVSVRDADSRVSTARYLERNPGLSFVAEEDGSVVGCVMCGHDGRRGYLQHLLVLPEYRRRGIANALVDRCLTKLEQLGIVKSHIDVFSHNTQAQAYWESQGWERRTDIQKFSYVRGGNPNA